MNFGSLLDGRHVTTHWRFARDVAQRFPNLKMDPNALFLKDGCFYTSAGITAKAHQQGNQQRSNQNNPMMSRLI
jgi:transcriptional regulator GlxA family with amidase domain